MSTKVVRDAASIELLPDEISSLVESSNSIVESSMSLAKLSFSAEEGCPSDGLENAVSLDSVTSDALVA